MWQHWVNAILGILVLLYPFFGLTIDALTTLLVITGIIIAVLGFWGAGVTTKRGGGISTGGAPGGGEGGM